MVVYGENDEYCEGKTKEIVELLQKNTKNRVDFKIIKAADHSFRGQEKSLAKILVKWLKK